MAVNIKQEAHRVVESLPEDASWDDVMWVIHMRQAIERGVEDSEAGRTTDVAAVRERYGLTTP